MKGSALLFSACKVVMARPDCWAGAKAEAELARRAAVRDASFIIVRSIIGILQVKDFSTFVVVVHTSVESAVISIQDRG